MGAAFFICPKCGTENKCNCSSCSKFIKQGDFINSWTEDGNSLICGKCKNIYSVEQAFDEEYKNIKQMENINYNK